MTSEQLALLGLILGIIGFGLSSFVFIKREWFPNFMIAVGLILLAITLFTRHANAQTILAWEPPTERENESALEGPLTFEVVRDGEVIYSGTETQLPLVPVQGINCYEIYAIDSAGLRSRPAIKCYELRSFPPRAPRLDEGQ